MLHRAAILPSKALALFVWMALAGAIHPASAGGDDAAIRSLMMHTWDKPGSKLVAEPIVVEGSYAVAGWTQGSRGGRALLRKQGDVWSVVLCSGDPLKHDSVLVEAGVPAEAAHRLARALNIAERHLPPEQVALFATFEGVMRMDEAHEHGKAHRPHISKQGDIQ